MPRRATQRAERDTDAAWSYSASGQTLGWDTSNINEARRKCLELLGETEVRGEFLPKCLYFAFKSCIVFM